VKRPACRLGPRLLAAFFFASTPALLSAATYLPLPDPELAARSPIIVRARVLRTAAALESMAGGEYPFTTVLLERLEAFKGEVHPVFRVRLPGGRVGDLAWTIPGTPEFSAGQEVVLFLGPHPRYPGEYRLTEFGLSKFDIVADSRDERFAVRPVFDAQGDDDVSGRSPGLSPQRPGAAPRRRRAESFLTALRNLGRGSAWPVEYGEPAFRPDAGRRPSWVNIGGVEGGNLFR
jgi:hypothetical protein